jgi:hypothetical protein
MPMVKVGFILNRSKSELRRDAQFQRPPGQLSIATSPQAGVNPRQMISFPEPGFCPSSAFAFPLVRYIMLSSRLQPSGVERPCVSNTLPFHTRRFDMPLIQGHHIVESVHGTRDLIRS